MNPRLWAALCMLIAMQSSGAAVQVFEVIHPEIEAGGFEFESLNGVSLVDVEEGDERSAHEIALGFALGVFVGREVPNEGGVDESTVSFGPVGEVGVGPASVTANSFVEVPVDDDVDPGLSYALAGSVPVAEAISLGFEAHGEVEQAFGDAPGLRETEHYIGPAAYLDLDLGRERVLEPRLAMLFGLTEGSSDAVLSLNSEPKF